MWSPALDPPWLARIATDPRRWGRALGVLWVLSTLAIGLLSLGPHGLAHHHGEGDLADDDHCVVCHLQASSTLPETALEIVTQATLQGRALQADLAPTRSAISLLGPPRRGPPMA